jgi:hypothetical protein
MMKGMIENGVRTGVRETYSIYKEVWEQTWHCFLVLFISSCWSPLVLGQLKNNCTAINGYLELKQTLSALHPFLLGH